MTPNPTRLSPDDSLARAEELMTLARIRHLPVVVEGKLSGLISHRDLLKASATRAPSTRVAEVMVTEIMTVGPTAPLRRAARLMFKEKIGCLPVVEGEQLVGIVTEADLVRFAADLATELDRMDAGLHRIGP